MKNTYLCKYVMCQSAFSVLSVLTVPNLTLSSITPIANTLDVICSTFALILVRSLKSFLAWWPSFQAVGFLDDPVTGCYSVCASFHWIYKYIDLLTLSYVALVTTRMNGPEMRTRTLAPTRHTEGIRVPTLRYAGCVD